MTMNISGSNGLTFPDSSIQAKASSMQLIASATASNSANISFTNISNTTYNSYRLYITNFIPSNSGPNLLLRSSVNGTFQTSAYTWLNERWVVGADGQSGQVGYGTGVALTSPAELMTNTIGGSWVVDIHNVANNGYKVVTYQGLYQATPGGAMAIVGSGWLNGSEILDGFQLLMDIGTITSGQATLYGII